MTITPLEQTLIDQARAHQKARAAYYPKYQAGPVSEDDQADYLKHSGALTGLLELAHFKSGLSDQAAEQLHQVEEEDAAVFRLHSESDFDARIEGLERARRLGIFVFVLAVVYAGVNFVVDPGPGVLGKVIASLGSGTAIAALLGGVVMLAGAQLKLWQLRQERKR